jgi:hypothetical protein
MNAQALQAQAGQLGQIGQEFAMGSRLETNMRLWLACHKGLAHFLAHFKNLRAYARPQPGHEAR